MVYRLVNHGGPPISIGRLTKDHDVLTESYRLCYDKLNVADGDKIYTVVCR